MEILFLSAWYPFPPNNGSKLRIYNLIKALGEEHNVSLLSFFNNGELNGSSHLEHLCQKINVVPEKPYNPKSIRALMGYFSAKPRVLVDRFVPQMAEQIGQEIRNGSYDLVIASQWYMADYSDYYKDVPAIFEEVEVGVFEDMKTHAKTAVARLARKLTCIKLHNYLYRNLPRFKACTVASETERCHLHKMVPNYPAIEVIPNSLNLMEYQSAARAPQPNTLIFTGSFHYSPNYKAMCWFVDQVLPIVRAQIPQVRLTITGDHAGQPLPHPGGVTLTGALADVKPLISSSWASLAPIWTGGGTRFKILESMALKTPVIATTKGAEGLNARHNEHLLIADSPESFAEAVIRVLKEPKLRERLADNAYRLVEERYDRSVVMPRFLDLIEDIVHG